MPKKKKEERCCHINRVGVQIRSTHIGGISMGQCERPVLPGMTVCHEHADKETLAFWIRELASRVIALGGKV